MRTYRFKDEHAILSVFTLQTGTFSCCSSWAHSNTMDIWWSWERERCHWITTVQIDSGYHVAFNVVPSSKHLCHHGCELQRMGPGKNPNRQLDNLRPAALHPCSSGPSSLGANYITKTVFNQVLPVPSPTSTPQQLPSSVLYLPFASSHRFVQSVRWARKEQGIKNKGLGCSSSCSTTTLSNGRARHD